MSDESDGTIAQCNDCDDVARIVQSDPEGYVCESCRKKRPTRHEIADALCDGDRNPVADADVVRNRDVEDIEVIHKGRDGSITLRYTYHTGYEGTQAGQVVEVNVLNPNTRFQSALELPETDE